MKDKAKSLSKEGRNALYVNMGNVINESFPILHKQLCMLAKLQAFLAENNDVSLINLKNIIELHSSILYVIIEVAVALRSDIRSEIIIERKVNLKYLVFITSEFYKATLEKSNSLLDKVSSYLTSLHIDIIDEKISEIKNCLNKYEQDYFSKDKNNRDISVHYDLDLKELYEYISSISEEVEAQRLCDFLAIVQPLNNLLTQYMSFIDANEFTNNEVPNTGETIFNKCLLNALEKRVYFEIGSTIQNLAAYLNNNMHTYCILDNLPEKLSSILGEDAIESLKEKREYMKLTILLNYIYIDLGVAIRGVISSEYFIERRINLIRLNLIIYEGYKKIYIQRVKNKMPLWNLYIYECLLSCDKMAIQQELEEVDKILSLFDSDSKIKDIRNKYVHLREKKIFNLPELWRILLNSSLYKELNKSLTFLQLLPRIIRLNCEAMNFMAENESHKTSQKLLEPYNQIKNKVLESNISQEKKEQFLKMLDDGMDKIMNIIK